LWISGSAPDKLYWGEDGLPRERERERVRKGERERERESERGERERERKIEKKRESVWERERERKRERTVADDAVSLTVICWRAHHAIHERQNNGLLLTAVYMYSAYGNEPLSQKFLFAVLW
jgi:hypothetical protein